MARRGRDLTKGNITSTLIKLALPTMGTGLVNMLYSLTDIMWLGWHSTKSLAAAGAAGFFIWFAAGVIMISQVGVGIGVAQSYGKNDKEALASYISNGLKLNLFLALSYSFLMFTFRHNLIGFYGMEDPSVVQQAIWYMEIISIGLIFQFFNPVISAIFNSTGNSLTPFIINTIGLIANMILDPLLIFGYGPFPALGIKGAAIATTLAQLTVLSCFIVLSYRSPELFEGVKIFKKPDMTYVKRIVKLGFPGFLQNSMHSGISMVIAKILAAWGETAIAVQSVGAQIESISWMTAEGFSAALTAFVGQNYGARNIDRVQEGYKKGTLIVSSIGLFAAILFIFFGESIFSLFVPNDPEAISLGKDYLRILGYSQVFICMEISSMGAFNGIGRPVIPAVIGMTLNALRIPISLFLSKGPLGLNGIWWSIAGTSIVKGSLSTPLCIYSLNRLEE